MMKSVPDLTPQPAEQQDSDPQTPSQVSKRIDPESLRLYNLAFSNRWPYRQVFRHISPTAPVFVYGSLMLPWVLARVLNHDHSTAEVEEVINRTTPATLSGFSRLMIKYTQVPTIVQKKTGDNNGGATVQGMLIGSVNDINLGKIEEYIGLQNHEQDIVEVEITIQGGDNMVVAAYVYVWKGPSKALDEREWSVLEYMKGNRPRMIGMHYPILETVLEE